MALETPLEHFQLQYHVAQRAMELGGLPLEKALMEFTSFWRRVGNAGWKFNEDSPQWTEYLQRIKNGEVPDQAAYDMFVQHGDQADAGKHYFGCFRYDFNEEFEGDTGVVKIHFRNNDSSGVGPLSSSRQAARHDELRQMFADVREHHGDAHVVHGGSWLYNVPTYCRLFPPAYTQNMKVEEVPFLRTSGIWGQFLNSENTLKPEFTQRFLKRVQSASSVDALLQCFEYKILLPRALIADFYEFYGLPIF